MQEVDAFGYMKLGSLRIKLKDVYMLVDQLVC